MRALAFVAGAIGAAAITHPATNVTRDTRACQPPYDKFPFCDTSLTLDQRINDIISRLLPTEIAPLITARVGQGGAPTNNISRIGVPAYDWGVNCIHGAQTSCLNTTDGTVYCPSSWPNPINYGMMWNKTAAYQLGAVVATELRALWLYGATEENGKPTPYAGLDCWSPNINIADPRWGRTQEVAGAEDPLLVGDNGAQYTIGLQTGEDSRYLKTVVTLKHWVAYDLENSDGSNRNAFDANVSSYALADTYFPPFQAAIQDGNAQGVMCSYNALNGVPTCCSDFLRTVIRDAWGFTGYITSDSGALENIVSPHHYAQTTAEAACLSIVNGTTDVCSGSTYFQGLMDGVSQGLCSMADVQKALYRTFKLRFDLGLFDPIDDQPYWNVPITAINPPEVQAENQRVTRSSMVLLTNDGTLPLAPGSKVAVIGPSLNDTANMIGNYIGQLCPDNSFDCVVSPFMGIMNANAGGVTTSSKGCDVNSTDTSGFAAAVATASAADYVIYMGGLDQGVEAEAHDRTSLALPGVQHQMIAALVATGKPVIVVLINGGGVDVTQETTTVKAIVEAGYPGYWGAQAIASTLFGTNEECCGRLAYTVYPESYASLITVAEQEVDVYPGRSYRYYAGDVVFPFGYGIALTTFNYSVVYAPAAAEAVLQTTATPTTSLPFVFNVTNTGTRTGDTVLQMFAQPSHPLPSQPEVSLIKQLVNYQRVHLAPGASALVSFPVDAATLVLTSKPAGHRVSTPGTFTMVVSDGAEHIAAVPVRVVGDEVIVERFPGSKA